MHHLLSPLLCLSVLYTSAIAVPAKRDVSANGYGKIFREIAGPATRDYTGAVDKTYRKYQWTSSAAAPERLATNAPVVTQNKDVISSAGGKGAGEAAATPQNHYNEYLVPVSIGGQTLMLDVDTGSSDLFVLEKLIAHRFLLTSVFPDGSLTPKCLPIVLGITPPTILRSPRPQVQYQAQALALPMEINLTQLVTWALRP